MSFDPDAAERLAALDAPWPMPEGELKRLEMRRWILRYAPKGGIGAEIGVFRGHFSAAICRIAEPRKLYLIDPWTRIGPTFGWSGPYTNGGALPTAVARDQAAARVAQFPQTEAVLIERYFPMGADQIAEPLDFAYLDASHRYDATLNELRHLEPLVQPDGVILGDDWAPDPAAQHHGVFRAVQDFVAEGRWQIIAAGIGGQWGIRRRPTYG